jgi:hypothetical protein
MSLRVFFSLLVTGPSNKLSANTTLVFNEMSPQDVFADCNIFEFQIVSLLLIILSESKVHGDLQSQIKRSNFGERERERERER